RCDQGHGGQARSTGLPHAALRDAIRGPRSRVLRGSAPQTTDQVSEVESRQARVPNHRSCGSLKARSFWREAMTLRYPGGTETLKNPWQRHRQQWVEDREGSVWISRERHSALPPVLLRWKVVERRLGLR